VLIRADAAGCTHQVLEWLAGQRLSYSVGFTLPYGFAQQLALIPDRVWAAAYDADGQARDGAWVAEPRTCSTCPRGRRGCGSLSAANTPPGAQLRITDPDGHRVTAFATNTTRGQLADLELRHRRSSSAEDPRAGQRARPVTGGRGEGGRWAGALRPRPGRVRGDPVSPAHPRHRHPVSTPS
jgi:hypothetical protein